jgi:hypothetical protein
MNLLTVLVFLILGFLVGGPIGFCIVLVLCVVISFSEVVLKMAWWVLSIVATYPIQIMFIVVCLAAYYYAVKP